jgi:hypothetical protein
MESVSGDQPGRCREAARTAPSHPRPDPPGQDRNRRPATARTAPDRSATRARCPATKAADTAGAGRPASVRHWPGSFDPRRRPSPDRHAARCRPRHPGTDARRATQTHHRRDPVQPDQTAIPQTGTDPSGPDPGGADPGRADPGGSDPPGPAVAGLPARFGPRRLPRPASRGASASRGGPARRWAASVAGPRRRRSGPRPCRRRPRRPRPVLPAGA